MDVQSYKAVGDRVAATVGVGVTTPVIPARANAIMIQNQDGSDDLRYTVDGSTPSTTVGFILFHNAVAEPIIIPLPHGGQFKMTRAASADVSVEYQFIEIKPRFW